MGEVEAAGVAEEKEGAEVEGKVRSEAWEALQEATETEEATVGAGAEKVHRGATCLP